MPGSPAADTGYGTTVQPDESTLSLDGGDTASENTVPQSVAPFSVWDFVRMAVVLGGVIAGIYGFLYLLKKLSGQKVQNNGLINLIGSQMLSGNRSLHIVQIGRQVFLVGASDGSVNLISEINDRESLDEIQLSLSKESSSERKSFTDVFSGLFGRPGMKPAQKSSETSMLGSVDFLKQQQERLKKL